MENEVNQPKPKSETQKPSSEDKLSEEIQPLGISAHDNSIPEYYFRPERTTFVG